MSHPRKVWGAALVLAGIQGAAGAAVSMDAAQDLARKSGLWVQLESLGTQVNSGMADAAAKVPGKVSPEALGKVTRCVQSAYAAESLRATAVGAVAGALQPADVPRLQAWYDSELGHRIAAMEEQSSVQTPDPQERVRRGSEALADAGDTRRAGLQAIVTQSHSVEMMTDTVIEMALAVREGTASLDPTSSDPSAAQLRATMAARRPQIMAHYAQISLNAYAFTYAGLSNDDLKHYVDFLSSPAGTALNDASMRGVARALNGGATQLGRCVKAAPPAS